MKLAAGGLVAALALAPAAWAADPLPSWNDGVAKRTLLAFVEGVTAAGSPRFVPVAERIAVFDNDGTLWSEQPIYIQLAFAFDRIHALAPQHPEWRDRQPFKAALANDVKGVLAGGEKALLELLLAAHAGNTTEEFDAIVRRWLATARHPTTGQPYTEMIYRPMLDLLDYLRSNGFRTFIVSGGGIEFLRAFAEPVYGVPPEQIVGSSVATRYEVRDGGPVLARLPEIDFIDDGAGKPVGIQRHIGRRPILAFGNSDGDFEMLEWTTSGPGARLGLLLRHDDAGREAAYDRDSPVGHLARALDEAPARGWTVVSMKRDWTTVWRDRP